MAPRTRRTTARRKSIHGLQDEETDIYDHLINQQVSGGQVGNQIEEYELSESVQNSQPLTSQIAPKEKLMAPRSKRSIPRRKSNLGLQDEEMEIYEHQIHQQSVEEQVPTQFLHNIVSAHMTSGTQRSSVQQLQPENSESNEEQGLSKKGRGPTYLPNI